MILCAKRTLGKAGEKCNQQELGCAVGSCDIAADASEGTCPKVIADGQPCTPDTAGETCDAFARCADGICQIPDPKRCSNADAG